MSYLLTFEGASSLVFTALCTGFVLVRVALQRRLEFLDWSVLFMGLVYGLLGPSVVDAIQSRPQAYLGARFLNPESHSWSFHTISAIVATIGLIVGWWVRAGYVRRKPRCKGLNRLSCNAVWHQRYLARSFWVMLCVSIVAQILYTLDYGGILGVIDYSRRIRSSVFEGFTRSRFSFLSPFAGFSMLACYGFFGLLLRRGPRPRTSILGFTLSLSFSLYVLYTWQGRLGMATFVAILILAFLLSRNIRPLTLVAGFFAAATVGMYGVYQVSELWALKRADGFSDFYTVELAFVFTGFWAEVSSGDSAPRLFYDVLVTPLFFLPSSLTRGHFENVMDVHTATMLGAPKGEAGVTSGMPLDMLTMGYMQGGLAGIALYAMLFGLILHSLQSFADSIEHPGVRASLSAYIALKVAGFALFYAQPEQVVGSNFPLLISLILLGVTSPRAEGKTHSSDSSANGEKARISGEPI